MPVKPIFDPQYFYLVTTTAIRHIHLFRQDVIKSLLLESLLYSRKEKQMKLFVFVIMPNHIHFIAQFTSRYPLSSVIRDFKKYTSRQIYHHFSVGHNNGVLEILMKEGQRVKQEYKVWEDGYDARDIFSTAFLQQKMDYIHNNPCQPRWELAARPEEYSWSTAGFCIAGTPCIIPIDDVREYL